MIGMIISLENIKIEALIGVYEIEKIRPNIFWVDIAVKIASTSDFGEDALAQTLDYEKLYQLVVTTMQEGGNLIEKKGYDMVESVLRDYPQVSVVEVKIKKEVEMYMKNCQFACIKIEKKRQ